MFIICVQVHMVRGQPVSVLCFSSLFETVWLLCVSHKLEILRITDDCVCDTKSGFCIGSKDHNSGHQTCFTAEPSPQPSYLLRLKKVCCGIPLLFIIFILCA